MEVAHKMEEGKKRCAWEETQRLALEVLQAQVCGCGRRGYGEGHGEEHWEGHGGVGAWGGVCWYVSTDLYVSLKTAWGIS